MNVTTTTAIRLSAEPVTRAGWRCPSCGTNYSPDLTFCHCSAVPALPPPVVPFTPLPVLCTCYQAWHGILPPTCPAHGQAQVITVTC